MPTRWIALAIGLIASMNAAAAQEVVPPAPIYSQNDGLFASPPAPVVPVAAPAETSLMVDVVFGLPIQLRLQRQVAETRAWIEGGLALYVIVPSFFAGVRFDGVLHQGERDGLIVRPGIDVYYSPIRGNDFLFGRYEGLGVLAADIDMIWRHRWNNGICGNIGVKLGCGVGTRFGDGGAFPVPILGFTMGLAY